MLRPPTKLFVPFNNQTLEVLYGADSASSSLGNPSTSPCIPNTKKQDETGLSRPGYTAKTDCNLRNFEHTIAEVFFNTFEKTQGEKNLNVSTSFRKLEDLKLVVF